MAAYESMGTQELQSLAAQLEKEYEAVKEKGLKLDMSRGKPGKEQLDLSLGLLDVLSSDVSLLSDDGTDCRNYGVLDGLPEARRLMGEIMGAPADQVIVLGNSSLNIMYDTVARAYTHGIGGAAPWGRQEKIRFLCPVPGYDRHFAITEHFGIEMVNVPMTPEGPDMDMVEELVTSDPSIKGIWCVPKYSNPQGISYSDRTVKRMAALTPAAEDFRIFWDNAYAVHHLYDDRQDVIENILDACKKAGHPDMVYCFASTSKITFPGAGIAAIAASKANIDAIKKALFFQTIGHDKLNQLRHVRYFKNADGIRAHMKKHAAIIRPKFELILDTLDRELTGTGAGTWQAPLGGYFIGFDAPEGCARAIVQKAKEAGLVMTGAGATFPYGQDPKDSNIRIAPTFPSLEDLKEAVNLFVLCVKIVSIQKILASRN